MPTELEKIVGDSAAMAQDTKGQPPPQAETPAADAGSGEPSGQTQVPLAALQAERAKAKRYTEQVASFEEKLQDQDRNWQRRFDALADAIRPPPSKPDFWADPEAAIDARLKESLGPVDQALARQRQEFSEMQAVAAHGEEAVNAAYQAIAALKTSSPHAFAADYQRIMASPHPYGALVQWHTQQQVLSEIGTDPAAYKAKVKAELLAELNAGKPPSQTMPSNFAAARNAGNRSGPAWAGPQPLADIFARHE